MTQKRRAAGWLRELRKKGITFDRSGRARKGSKFVSSRSLEIHLTKIRGRSEARPTRTPSNLDRQLDRWGVDEAQRAKITPALVAKVARVSQKKAREWIRDDGMPKELLDRVGAKLTGNKIYRAKWKHGTKGKASGAEEKELRKAFKDFLRAREKGDPKAFKLYEKWRAIKEYLRKRLTMKEWRRLVSKIGRAEGLQKEGLFSIMRFILS